jgi:hypothetical protein
MLNAPGFLMRGQSKKTGTNGITQIHLKSNFPAIIGILKSRIICRKTLLVENTIIIWHFLLFFRKVYRYLTQIQLTLRTYKAFSGITTNNPNQ